MRSIPCLLALSLAVSVAGCPEEEGPPPSAALRGSVTEGDTGRLLENVTVSIQGVNPPLETQTSSAGTYLFRGLVSGTRYTVLATLADHDAQSATTEPLEPGDNNTLDFTLPRRRVCTPGTKRCTGPGVPAGILTCNGDGTDYDSSPCASGQTCDPAMTMCVREATLTITLTGSGDGRVLSLPAGISCPPDCDASFLSGTNLQLTAIAESTSRFITWGAGACMAAARTATCTFSLSADATAIARFDSTLPRLTVRREGMGNGVVRSTPSGIDCGMDCTELYTPGTTIVLDARPDNRSIVGAWVTCPASNGNQCTIANIMASRGAVVRFDPFFEGQLAADANCRTLLRFDPPDRFDQRCGGGAPAVVTGTVSFVASRTGVLGEAYEAVGPTDNGSIDTMKPGPGSIGTVEMTVYRVGDAFGAQGLAMLFSDQPMLGQDQPGFSVALFDDGRLAAATFDGAGGTTRVESAADAVAVGTWTHIAVTINQTNGLRLFADGQAIAEAAGPLLWTASSSTAWAGAGRVDAQGTSGYRFNGRIDELRVSATERYRP
ncbi:MAG: carboxypeptidase regulatory-like domain-containing protein [Deltaproteobacteria bacterium]|nr:carboxypeptidase regulatory-like domain-containing protein [Deltaproteobacteria bacterium]